MTDILEVYGLNNQIFQVSILNTFGCVINSKIANPADLKNFVSSSSLQNKGKVLITKKEHFNLKTFILSFFILLGKKLMVNQQLCMI
jgi:hypothetical protein